MNFEVLKTKNAHLSQVTEISSNIEKTLRHGPILPWQVLIVLSSRGSLYHVTWLKIVLLGFINCRQTIGTYLKNI